MRDVIYQIRRGLTAPNVALVFSLLIYGFIFPYLDTPLFYSNPISFFRFENFYYYFIQSFKSDMLRYVVPIAAILPLGFSFVEDKNTRFYDMAAARVSDNMFVVRRAVASLLTTAIIICAACVTYTVLLLILSTIHGGHGAGERWIEAYQRSSFAYWVKKEHFVFFVLWQICLIIFSSCIWSMFAMCLSFIWQSKEFVFLVTFGCSLLLDSLLEQYCGLEFPIYYLQAPNYIIATLTPSAIFLRIISYLSCITFICLLVARLSVSKRIRQYFSRWIPQVASRSRERRKRKLLSAGHQGTEIARFLVDVQVNCTIKTIMPAVIMPLFIVLCRSELLTAKFTVGDLLMHIFGGMYWFDPAVNFAPIGYWILILMPCMLGVALNLDREMGSRLSLVVHRYPNMRSWWLSKYLACNVYVVLNTTIMFLTTMIIAVVAGADGFGIWMADADGFPCQNSVIILELFHTFTWQVLFLTQIQVLFHAISNHPHVGFVAHLLPLLYVMVMMSIFDRPINANIPYQWGILLRSELFSPQYMSTDMGESIELCSVDIDLCLYGQIVVTGIGGVINAMLFKVVPFKERRQNV